MKGIFCAKCFTIRSLSRIDMNPVECECGNLCGWWIDGAKGIARFAAKDRDGAFMVGWNNNFLRLRAEAYKMDHQAMRDAHDICTDTPGYFFDKSRAACWSVILVPGHSSDTSFATAEELEAVKAAVAARSAEIVGRTLAQLDSQYREAEGKKD